MTVEELDEATLRETQDLKEALELFRAEHGFGRGIAASQIGVAKRMLALNLGSGTFVALNPRITSQGKETFTLWDDCMSFPDLLVRVMRFTRVSVAYETVGGDRVLMEDLSPAFSELLQHEIDHLDGILALDRATSPRDIVYRAEYERHRDYYDTLTETAESAW